MIAQGPYLAGWRDPGAPEVGVRTGLPGVVAPCPRGRRGRNARPTRSAWRVRTLVRDTDRHDAAIVGWHERASAHGVAGLLAEVAGWETGQDEEAHVCPAWRKPDGSMLDWGTTAPASSTTDASAPCTYDDPPRSSTATATAAYRTTRGSGTAHRTGRTPGRGRTRPIPGSDARTARHPRPHRKGTP